MSRNRMTQAAQVSLNASLFRNGQQSIKNDLLTLEPLTQKLAEKAR